MPCGRKCHKCVWPIKFVSLKQMLTPIGSISDRFHFVLAIPSKIIRSQEFTQTFVSMTIRAQIAKFALLIFDSQVVGEGSKARPVLSMVLLEQIQDYQAGEYNSALRKHREVQVCYKPTESHKFQYTYFPCSLDSVLQILNRGREQAYETRSGASLRQSRSWTSLPLRCS